MAKSPAKKKATGAAKKKTAPKKRAPRAATGEFVATVTANEQEFTSSGATALEACEGLNVPPFMLKTKAYLRLDHKGKTAEVMMLAIQLRRFINNKVAREIQAKRLASRLA